MLHLKKGCFELTCRSVNNVKIAILVCANGKLCICMDRQLSMVDFNLSMYITVLRFNGNISTVQILLIYTIHHMLRCQSLSQNPVSSLLIFLQSCISEQVIGNNNEKMANKCAIYSRSNKHIKFWLHTGVSALTKATYNYQDKDRDTCDKQSNNKFITYNQRKDKSSSTQLSEQSRCNVSKEMREHKTDGDVSDRNHDDDNHDKKDGFIPAHLILSNLLLILIILLLLYLI